MRNYILIGAKRITLYQQVNIMANWNKKTLYERIDDRWKEKDTDYGRVNPNRDLMSIYFRSDEVIEVDDKGHLVGQEIYNGSGSWYSRMMATGFQGSLVSKNIPWFRYMMEEFELKGIDELDTWLQEIKTYMADAYQRSNFYDVQPQFTHDGLTIGSPVLFGEENIAEEKTMWMPQHYKTVRVYYDKFNQPEGVIIRDETWTAKQIFDIFIKNDDVNGTKRKEKLSIAVNTSLDAGLLDEVFTVYKAVFKVTDPIWNDNSDDKDKFIKPVGDWKWLSVYFLELTEAERNKRNRPLNDDIGDFVQPFAVWDFDKKPWEAASRTPAWYAIWDCISLQEIDKNYLEDIQNTNRPAFIALTGMQGRVNLGPEGEMYVSDKEWDRPPKLIERTKGLQFSRDLIEIKEDALKRWFYIDRFQMFSDLARLKNQPVTATQIWQMAGEKSTLLSPAIETHSRYLEATDARMVDFEVRAGRGPFNPQIIANITDIVDNALGRIAKSVGVRPVFIGQLAQAQKVSQAMQPIMSSIGAAMDSRLFDLDPDLRFAIRGWDTLNDIFEANDFPQKNFVSKEEFAKIKAGLAKQRAQDKQFEQAAEMSKASKDTSQSVANLVGAGATAAGAEA